MKTLLLLIFVLPIYLAYGQQNDLQLWYNNPAQNWTDALPVGNGRLGGMVFVNYVKENIQLNESCITVRHVTAIVKPINPENSQSHPSERPEVSIRI